MDASHDTARRPQDDGLESTQVKLSRAYLIATSAFTVAVAVAVQLSLGQPLVTAAVVVLVFALGMFVSRMVLDHTFAPFDDLVEQAERFAKGERPVVFTEHPYCEEVVDLERSLNRILSEMSKADEELRAEEERQAQFVSDVSHEIRTPLTAIQGTAETLMDPDMPQEMREKFLSNIIDESQRLTRLANDLLTLNRIEGASGEVEMRRLNLRELADATAVSLAALFEERQVSLTVTGEAPDIMGNADRIRQVITNLAENASRFAPKNGHVRIKLQGIGGNSVLSVSDDGPGFGDVDPARLFDRFYRADSSRARGRGTGGTGLGLAIVKAIVEQHNGTVEAVNLPERGACFITAFPSLGPADDDR